MIIEVGPELEAMLILLAENQGVAPEKYALDLLAQRINARIARREPKNDFEAHLRAAASPCGVSLTDEDLSRETMYD